MYGKDKKGMGLAATTLQHASLPEDVVMNNVIPFLELPKYRNYLSGHHELLSGVVRESCS